MVGSGLLLGVGLSGVALAADTTAPADDLQEIVVTGLRGSMEKSLDLKKDAAVVLDSPKSADSLMPTLRTLCNICPASPSPALPAARVRK
jgi:hypothetical protein